MCENFKRIPSEDQQRILQACLEEFAAHGYQQASTNAIVRRAGIPKGTLFFFFGNKQKLYLYLIDHAVRRFAAWMEQSKQDMPSDLFERLLQRGRLRMQFAVQESLLYRFFYQALLHTPPEIQAQMQARYAGYAEASARQLYDGLDRSKFRPGVDVEKAVALVNLVLEGLFSRHLSAFQDMPPEQTLAWVDSLDGEVRGYFELLKSGMYEGV
jgi:TetR/AcrR family transcriptional regulator